MKLTPQDAEAARRMIEKAAEADGAIAEAREAFSPQMELAVRLRSSQLDSLNAGMTGAVLSATGRSTPEQERVNARNFPVIAMTTAYALGWKDAMELDGFPARVERVRQDLQGKIAKLDEILHGPRKNYAARLELRQQIKRLRDDLEALDKNVETVYAKETESQTAMSRQGEAPDETGGADNAGLDSPG